MGRAAVVYAYGEGLRALGKQLAEAVVGFAQLDGAVVKLRAQGRQRGRSAGPRSAPSPDERASSPSTACAYEVHPLGRLNVGLFTDMREQRLGLARFAAGKRVLNLFSYTGALGARVRARRCGEP